MCYVLIIHEYDNLYVIFEVLKRQVQYIKTFSIAGFEEKIEYKNLLYAALS